MMIKAHEAEQPKLANEFVQHEGPCSHYSRVTQAANTARGCNEDHHAMPLGNRERFRRVQTGRMSRAGYMPCPMLFQNTVLGHSPQHVH